MLLLFALFYFFMSPRSGANRYHAYRIGEFIHMYAHKAAGWVCKYISSLTPLFLFTALCVSLTRNEGPSCSTSEITIKGSQRQIIQDTKINITSYISSYK